jgi:tetratricopeptide (TPR) repeat protein
LIEQAVATGEAALGPNHPDVAIRHHNLGSILGDLGDLAAARAEYERALEMLRPPCTPMTRT